MNAFQIESWAIRVIERVEMGQPDEDFLVELKSEWPEPPRAARRIAAHANTARGEPILWLIGVDQKARAVTGVSHNDLSVWFDQVKAQFDERFAPAMKDLNVSYNGKSVVALLFDTERFPFVVKTTDGRLEVPWREGTSTRSAKRSDLLKLLVPLQALPRIEVLSGVIELWLDPVKNADQHEVQRRHWRVELDLYLEPPDHTRLVIPFHKCQGFLGISSENYSLELSRLQISPPKIEGDYSSKTIEETQDELLVYGPGRITFSSTERIEQLPSNLDHALEVSGYIQPSGADHHVSFMATFASVPVSGKSPRVFRRWELI